jgi:hypothetical protein
MISVAGSKLHPVHPEIDCRCGIRSSEPTGHRAVLERIYSATPPFPASGAILSLDVRLTQIRETGIPRAPRNWQRHQGGDVPTIAASPGHQVCGFRRGNKSSSACTGKRSDTSPFGVSEASIPSAMTSFKTRRADLSGRPVILSISPRSNSPRLSASSNSPTDSGFRDELFARSSVDATKGSRARTSHS